MSEHGGLRQGNVVQQPAVEQDGGPLTHADVALTTAVDTFVADRSPANARILLDQIAAAEQIFSGQYSGIKELVNFRN